MEIVSALRNALADRVGNERFDLWFGCGTQLELTGGSLTIAVPSPFLVEFLRANFRQAIEVACRETLGSVPEVRFRVAEKPADGEPERPAASPQGARGAEKPTARPAEPSGWSARRRFADLESFVVGDGNRLAQAAAWRVAQRPGELSPLLIHGPTGVGKTHLLEGIWTVVRRANPRSTVVYLSAEQFATGFLQALRGSGLPSFRRKHRGVDLLIIDDLQFLCGKKYTQIELLYTMDTLEREGRQLVLAGDRRPHEFNGLGEEMTGRLAGGMAFAIDPPDFQTRLGIAGQMARRFGMHVPEEVLRLLASRLTRHARELSGALCRLRAAGEAWRRPITLAMAEESLADMLSASSPVVRLPDIERAVCNTFGLGPEVLQSESKARRINHPRMLAMWLARKYTRSALSEIGQYFGRRSHSTVISAQKRVDGWLSSKSTVDLADRTWGVEEAVRQVEQCLRAS